MSGTSRVKSSSHFPISYGVHSRIVPSRMFPTIGTPVKPVEVPYWEQPHASSTNGAPKDLESNDGLIRGQWAVGFCDCFTDLMPNCFMVTCCSCISMAQISARLGVTSYSNALVACLVVVIAEFVVEGIGSSTTSST
ncbi:PLAC8 family protein, partial [Phytophthora palmivora]